MSSESKTVLNSGSLAFIRFENFNKTMTIPLVAAHEVEITDEWQPDDQIVSYFRTLLQYPTVFSRWPVEWDESMKAFVVRPNMDELEERWEWLAKELDKAEGGEKA